MKWKSVTALTLALGFALTGCTQAGTGTPVGEKPALTVEQISQLPVAERTAEYNGAPAASEDFKYKIATPKLGLAFTPAYDAPDGKPVALIAEAIRSDFIWTPVIDEREGWLKIMLPGKNAGSSKAEDDQGVAGWVSASSMEVKEHTREVIVSAHKREVQVLKQGELLASYDLQERLQEPDVAGRKGFIAIEKWGRPDFESCNIENGFSTSLLSERFKHRTDVGLSEAKPYPEDADCHSGAKTAWAMSVGTFRLSKSDMKSLQGYVSPGTPIHFVK